MLRYLALAFFAVATAEIFYDGPCPEVTPVENFDMSAYQGLWYEVARFPYKYEYGTKGKCSTAEFTLSGKKGKVKNSQVVDGVKSYVEGEVELIAPGQLKMTYTMDGVKKPYTAYVLATDYKNYAITYVCRYYSDTNKHQVLSWIKSRSRTLEGAAKEAVDNYLKSSTVVEKSHYENDDQSDASCSAFY